MSPGKPRSQFFLTFSKFLRSNKQTSLEQTSLMRQSGDRKQLEEKK